MGQSDVAAVRCADREPVTDRAVAIKQFSLDRDHRRRALIRERHERAVTLVKP
jgi:hypothetical protein